MLGLGWEKVGDLDTFDPLMKCHRKTLRFSSLRYVEQYVFYVAGYRM